MQATLNLVRGAVSTKDLIPVLTHFHIHSGRIQGGNGRIVIDAPCDELKELNVTVPAERFLKAVDACDGEPNIKITDAGKLSLSRGKFRALLPLASHETFPRSDSLISLRTITPGTLLPALKRLRPFIGTDASRPWVCSVAVRSGEAYATNNVVLVRTPCSFPFEVDIPVLVIDELLRIGKDPIAAVVTDNKIQFAYEDKSWVQGALFHDRWMTSAFEVIDSYDWGDQHAIEGLKEAVAKVRPFVPDEKVPIIRLGAHGVSTREGDHYAVVEGMILPESQFRAEPLEMVLAVATHMGLDAFPRPIPWIAPELEGVLLGIKI